MTERNICTESGCKAYCCRDVTIHFAKEDREDLQKYWPTAERAVSLLASDILTRRGVFYADEGEGFILIIKGKCPNLKENFDCKYGEDRPGVCRKFDVGCNECTLARISHFLPPFKEWQRSTELQPEKAVK